ncbi:helix-turn-helix domain-containing protein [Bradyrhizobium japonicum]|uniref:helix-turn-helix domain-containing protein n=1 Tax=Bradyrhizobium japonicum TaxID=375 RepID=UPI001E4426EA|nr:helix-turn-helix domain-containing protein [Bradyrhizobium japonicum]MCD9110097.1 helix-turn-helix domain-containing protein [Bradyrhizobium japonicum]MCS3982680.1 DNA-binding Lrp family transcriptional regulator [Bradyrhizobium japonicum]WRI72049.1 helix-turn-helix domain-containing protein [Bradyrhizobium japonicum]
MATADTKPRTNRRRENRQKFIWLDQVKADDKLPRSAFVVAFQLMQGFNAEYGGAAWKSIETLADETGLSEPSIVRITRRLTERGHLKIDPGKAGRGGHSNRYFMVKKTSAQTSAGDPQTSAGGGDLLKNHLTGEAEEASPVKERENELTLAVIPASPPAPVGGAQEGKEVAVDRFSELWALWSSERRFPDTDDDEREARKAFVVICREHPDIADEIIAAARKFIAAIKAKGFNLPKLWKWLCKDNWRKEPPARRQRRGTKPALAEMMLRWGQT